MNRETFLQAFEEYHKAIYNFVYFRVACKREVAEDLTQETYLKAWKYRDSFDSEKATINTWLHTIAGNLVKDYYAKNNVNAEQEFREEYMNTRDEVDRLTDENAKIDLYRLLSKLSEEEREMIIMRYIEDLDIEQVAENINKSYSATKVALHRILNKLKHIANYE